MTNNILQTKDLTVFANEDYTLLKNWQNVFATEVGDLVVGDNSLSLEQAYRLGASNMLNDVLGFIEWPTDEAIDSFKKLTTSGINKWVVGGLLVGLVAGTMYGPRILHRIAYGKGNRKDFTWKTLI